VINILSLGAGVQSTTMALMAAHGEIKPMPDCAIFADTGWEPKAVYDHLEWLMSPNVLPFPVHVVQRGDLGNDSLKVKTSRKTKKRYLDSEIPFFGGGLFGRRCTGHYKIDPIRSKIRELLERPQVRWREEEGILVNQWIGISVDEAHRMKPDRMPWIENRWPLIEKRMARHNCLNWMTRNDYPQPPRSACVFCPYHSNHEWKRLRDNEPEEFARAVEYERRLHVAFDFQETMQNRPYLHRDQVPLGQVDLSTLEDHGQLNMFNNECEGMCGV
jgi:hypothetical protein